MDEKDKKIAELTKALEDEKVARQADKVVYEKTLKEKDVLIDQKNQDLIGIRKENTKLKELTAEEKAKMSEVEIKHHEALLASQQEAENLKKSIAERDAKEVESRKERIFSKFAGKDAGLKAKLQESFGKIIGHDKAQTEEEIAKIAQDAFNMLGVPKPDPIREVINGAGGGDGDHGQADNYSNTDAGKTLTQAMGLPVEPPKA